MAKKSKKANAAGASGQQSAIKSVVVDWDVILQELEAEFCPPLDSTLVVSMLYDTDLSPASIVLLKNNLSTLVYQTYQAEEQLQQNSAEISVPDDTESTSTSFGPFSSSATSTSSFTMPTAHLEFLQRLFPRLPPDILATALVKGEADDGEPSMEVVVDRLLTEELLWEEAGGQGVEYAPEKQQDTWANVSRKKKQKGKKGVTLPLTDIRQHQHYQRPHLTPHPTTARSYQDSWVQISSIASHLHELVPSVSPGAFNSLFHKPSNKPPGDTLAAFLQTLPTKECIDHQRKLAVLVGILGEDNWDEQNADHCLRATGGSIEAAFDLIQLIETLNAENSPLIFHSRSADVSPNRSTSFLPMTPTLARRNTVAAPTSSTLKVPPHISNEHEWQSVPKPQKSRRVPLSAFIPAYKDLEPSDDEPIASMSTSPHLQTFASLNSANPTWTPAEYEREADAHRKARLEALRTASRAYGKGVEGGGVVAVYSERAREHFEKSEKWSLKAALAHVEEKQKRSGNIYEIDLHGVTVRQAITITKNCVETWWSSSGAGTLPLRDLTIITGQGNHSSNGKSKLSPAVYNMLLREGWDATKFPGGVIVRGIAPQSSRYQP